MAPHHPPDPEYGPAPASEAARRGWTYRPDLVPDDFPAAEIFGFPPEADTDAARESRDGCRCPFKGGACTKLLSGAGTGVCSLRYKAAGFESSVIWATCANRLAGPPFHEAMGRYFEDDVGAAELVTEVRMKDPDVSFDGVGVHVRDDESVDFFGIEAQTIDTRGGKIRPIFDAYVSGEPHVWKDRYPKRPAFGVNTTNVWKRLLPQVMNKGRMFSDWEGQLYVILQDTLMQFIRRRMPLDTLSQQEREHADIVWLPWDYTGAVDPETGQRITKIGEPVLTTLAQVERAFVTIHAAQRPKFVETVLGKLGRDVRKVAAAQRRAAQEAAELEALLVPELDVTELDRDLP